MGLEATTITIEVNLAKGLMFHLSGLADTAVKESYDRISAALPNVGYINPSANLTINLSPADLKKGGELLTPNCNRVFSLPQKNSSQPAFRTDPLFFGLSCVLGQNVARFGAKRRAFWGKT